MVRYYDEYTFYRRNENGEMALDDSAGFIGGGFYADTEEEAVRWAVKDYATYLIEDDYCHIEIDDNVIWFNQGDEEEWQNKVIVKVSTERMADDGE